MEPPDLYSDSENSHFRNLKGIYIKTRTHYDLDYYQPSLLYSYLSIINLKSIRFKLELNRFDPVNFAIRLYELFGERSILYTSRPLLLDFQMYIRSPLIMYTSVYLFFVNIPVGIFKSYKNYNFIVNRLLQDTGISFCDR
jgi:hypothetical protein